MKKIYKYSLPVQEKYSIELPAGAKIIRVEDVDGLFFLWAMVDTSEDHPKEPRGLYTWDYVNFLSCRNFGLYCFERVEIKQPYTT